jgi:putative transposase
VAKNGHSEEQILRALREAEGGSRVADICREHGVSEATFYIWKKKYSGLGLSELRELRQLREENSKLKHLVADLSLDRQILQEIVQKSCEASSSARARALDADRLRTEHAAGVGADDDQPIDHELPEPARSAARAANADARAGSEPGAVSLSTPDRDASARGLGGERQAHLSLVHPGRTYSADQGA